MNGGTFQVLKIDFTPSIPLYIDTPLTMGQGSALTIHSIVRTSTTNANDFYFAGKTNSLSDGTTTKNFSTQVGFIMKVITNNTDESYFSFPSGYALNL